MRGKRKGVYYLGRVIKRGILDNRMLTRSILNPNAIQRGKHNWTFIEGRVVKNQFGDECIFAKLSKYSPDAKLRFVRPELHAEEERAEPNLSIAVCPFVYVPSQSGIAFLHVARHIPHWLFIKRFSEVIEETNGHFFIECGIETIADLRSFATKLQMLDGVFQISASVVPPNPLFGILWESLRDYLAARKLDSLEITEESKSDTPIETDLPRLVKAVADGSDLKLLVSKGGLPIADSAILMAADGYGHGFVEGKQEEQSIIIRTSETIRNFRFDREPEPDELVEVTSAILVEIEEQRNLQH